MNTTPMNAIEPGQISFDPLHFEEQMGLSPTEATKEALTARGVLQRQINKYRPDLKAKAWTLTGQLRKYKSFGEPCGRVRNVYYLTISKK